MNWSRFKNPIREPRDEDREQEIEDEKANHARDIAASDDPDTVFHDWPPNNGQNKTEEKPKL